MPWRSWLSSRLSFTSSPSSGKPRCLAYNARVSALHAPSAASNRSWGSGAEPAPPSSIDTSLCRVCGPMLMQVGLAQGIAVVLLEQALKAAIGNHRFQPAFDIGGQISTVARGKKVERGWVMQQQVVVDTQRQPVFYGSRPFPPGPHPLAGKDTATSG